jgi:hypothetical protein
MKKLSSRYGPIRKDPDFREVLMLPVEGVILGKHFAELLSEFVRLAFVIGVVLAFLVVADAESRTATIAKLEGFDRIARVLGNFFIEDRYRAVQIAGHVILRWG